MTIEVFSVDEGVEKLIEFIEVLKKSAKANKVSVGITYSPGKRLEEHGRVYGIEFDPRRNYRYFRCMKDEKKGDHEMAKKIENYMHGKQNVVGVEIVNVFRGDEAEEAEEFGDKRSDFVYVFVV